MPAGCLITYVIPWLARYLALLLTGLCMELGLWCGGVSAEFARPAAAPTVLVIWAEMAVCVCVRTLARFWQVASVGQADTLHCLNWPGGWRTKLAVMGL